MKHDTSGVTNCKAYQPLTVKILRYNQYTIRLEVIQLQLKCFNYKPSMLYLAYLYLISYKQIRIYTNLKAISLLLGKSKMFISTDTFLPSLKKELRPGGHVIFSDKIQFIQHIFWRLFLYVLGQCFKHRMKY